MIDYKVSPKAERYFKKLKDKELKKKYHEAIYVQILLQEGLKRETSQEL